MITTTKIKALRPRQSAFKVFDSKGLFILVYPTGTLSFRFRYRFNDRERLLGLGTFPEVELAQARKARDAARKLLAQGIDPSEARKADKARDRSDAANSFAAYAEGWFTKYHGTKSEATTVRNRRLLKYLVKHLGTVTISKISRAQVAAAVQAIETASGAESAHRALNLAALIFASAAVDGLVSSDPVYGVRGKLGEVVARRRVAITKASEVGELMRAIYKYSERGLVTTVAALKLLALTFTRPGELRQAEWSEFDLDQALWTVPKSRMKSRRHKNSSDHLVPLSTQAVDILRELHKQTGSGRFVFPTARPTRPLSENGFTQALQNMGYSGERHTAHGFRSTASTLLHEMNFDPQTIETQLAHARSGVSAVYNRSHLLPARKAMMQAWSDHLDALRTGSNVIPINAGKKS